MSTDPQWNQPLISVDVVPFYFNPQTQTLNVVLGERQHEPSLGVFALPGVLLLEAERAEEAAYRALANKIGIPKQYIRGLKDIGVADNPDRDERGPSLSIIFVAFLETALDIDSVNILDVNKLSETVLPFDHSQIVSRAVNHVHTNILNDKETTKAVVGETFRTTEMFTLLNTLHNVTGVGVAPDSSNLSRKLRGMNWFSRSSEDNYYSSNSISSDSLSESSKGRPSSAWIFS